MARKKEKRKGKRPSAAAASKRAAATSSTTVSRKVSQAQAHGASRGGASLPYQWRFLHQHEFDGAKWGEPAIYATPRTLDSLVRETAQNSLDAGGGDKVTMRYRLYDLSPTTQRYLRLMSAVRFEDELKPHLEMAVADAGKRDVGVRLSDGLESMSATRSALRVLTIEDYGAKGLGGGEFESGSAFAALVRDISNSQKSDQTAGGSYGLGSRTLFGSSRIMTVLFASTVAGNDESKVRLIAKSDLSYHRDGSEGQRYAGRGWMGKAVGEDGAYSVWLDRDDSLLSNLLARREPPDGEQRLSGTTAVILAFSESKADEQSGDDVSQRIVQAVAENFWPAITVGQLSVEVEHYVDDEKTPTFTRKVRPIEYVPSLVDAFQRHLTGDLSEKLVNPGDTVSEPIELVVPATHPDGGVDPQNPETIAECRLVIRLAEPDPIDRQFVDHVGYSRGRGMITQYVARRNLAAGARPFHAALLAGSLAGKGAPEFAAERFLRFAEPPAHNVWEAENLGSRYMRGGGRRLAELDQRIREALRRHVCAEPSESDEGPEVLKEIFRLRKLPNPPEPGIRVTAAKAPFANGVYHVSATLTPERDGGCRIQPQLSIAKEQGQPIRTEWVTLSSPDAELVGGSFVVLPGVKRIRVSGTARVRQAGLDPERCVVRVSAAYARVGGDV